MKTLQQIREASGGKEAYQKFFNTLLKKFGVKSQAELEGDKKKKFYDALDAGWEGDNEKPEAGDKKESVELEEGMQLKGIYKALKSLATKPEYKKVANALNGLADFPPEGGEKKAAEAVKRRLVQLSRLVKGKKEQKKLLKLADFASMFESVELDEVFSQAQMKKAIDIARKSTGNYDKAYAEIEKIKKGLGDEHIVANALKKANESVDEAVSVDCRTKGYKEAIKRNLVAKEKREAKKIKLDAAKQKACEEDIANSTGVNIAGVDKPLGKVKKRVAISFKESVDLEEGVSSEAKAVMKEINKHLKILKTELKTSDENQDWKARLNRIEGIIGKVKWTVDEAITEAKGSDCTIQNDGRNNIAVCIDGLSFADARKGTRGAMMNIDDFKKKAKVAYADSKGKPTLPAVKKEIKALGAKNFYAKWQADSSSYKDDSVQIWFTK